MSACKHGGLGIRHPAEQGLYVAVNQSLGQNIVVVLDRIDQAAARLSFNIDSYGAKRQFSLECPGTRPLPA